MLPQDLCNDTCSRWNPLWKEGNPLGVVVNVLDCDIIIREFELLLVYYILFQTNIREKGMGPLIPAAND